MNEKYVIELTQHLPIRNINFYLDACSAMNAVNRRELSVLDNNDISKIEALVLERGLERKPKEAIEMLFAVQRTNQGVKSIGKLILSSLRLGRFNTKDGPCSDLPCSFLIYVIVEDLKLHGQGPCYTLVEKFTDEVIHEGIVHPACHASTIQSMHEKYIHEDMAAIFLGYSFLNEGDPRSIVSFPSNKTGFVARLFHDVHTLFPRLSPMKM